jgi:hypothetical protein
MSALEPRVATFHGKHGNAPAHRSVLEDIEHPRVHLDVIGFAAVPARNGRRATSITAQASHRRGSATAGTVSLHLSLEGDGAPIPRG